MKVEHDLRSREQLAALYEISRAVNSTLEVGEVLDAILGMTLDLFQAEAGSIMLLQDGVLRIRCARGLSEEVIRTTEVPLGQGIAGWVARTGEMLLLNGRVDDSRFSNVVDRRDEITSSLCTPLRSRDGVLGVMMVRRGGTRAFSRGQLDFFASVADQAAVALENARLFRSERQRAGELAVEKQKFQAILADMADGVLVTDGDGCLSHVNAAGRALLGLPEEHLGRPLADWLPGLALESVKERLLQGDGPCEMDATIRGEGGPTILRVTATRLAAGLPQADGLVLLLHDVTERVRVERMKSEFLSAVSHELKTPLTTISGFLELMLNREFERSRQVQYLTIGLGEAQRLQRLIEDLLTLSRLESGQFRLQTRPVRLDQVASALVTGFAERYPAFGFRFSALGNIPVLEVDEDLVSQVLVNLLSNAVKYSPQGGQVEVQVQADGQSVRVSVSDQGIGIPKDKYPYIFDRFYRVDNSLTRTTGGIGLGLANARYIVEGHGGAIWVESAEGQGSRFIFVLPVQRREPSDSEA